MKKLSSKLDGFAGINNVLKPENTPDKYLKKADNVDLDKAGNIHKRKGYSLLDSGNYQVIWSNGKICYAVKDGDLVKVNPDYSTALVKQNTGIVDFAEVNGLVYFVSPTGNGVIDNGLVRTWGIAIPSSPELSITTGILAAGTYQVCYTYIDDNGMESGAPVASVITVQDNSGITVNIKPSSDARVTGHRIYCSTQDGIDLFYIGENINTISSVTRTSNPLRMFNLAPSPYGKKCAYFKGRMYIVEGNIIWYSEPLQYEHFKIDSSYLDFEDNVVGIMPVEDGLWVATEKSLYFAFGGNPFTLTLKEAVSMVRGTDALIDSSYIDGGIGYKWMITTNSGVFILSNEGQCSNITANNVSIGKADSGAGLFTQHDGINQYMSILKKNDQPNNSVFGDQVTSTIIRNGVAIPN